MDLSEGGKLRAQLKDVPPQSTKRDETTTKKTVREETEREREIERQQLLYKDERKKMCVCWAFSIGRRTITQRKNILPLICFLIFARG